MITLNTDQGLVNIECWEDVTAQPGFVNDLNPHEHQLDAIIGRYMFRDKVKCGLSNCHTPHNKGYIALTKQGLKTNIGHDCGRSYFGVHFETMSRKFERDLEEKQHREALTTFAFREDQLGERLRSLREGEFGVNRLHGLLKELRQPGGDCPGDLVTLIAKMVRTRNATLSIERVETESEAALRDLSSSTESLDDSEPNVRRAVRYVEEKIADIRGFDSLYPENDLSLLLPQ